MFKAYNQGFTGKNFDSFDPDINSFDPSIGRKANNADGNGAAYATQTAKPGQKMQINITVTNSTAVTQTAEIFQWLDSVTKRYKAELVPSDVAYAMIPETSHEGLRRVVANTGGTVAWGQNGDLQCRGDDTAPDPLLLIGCSEIAYRSLFEASGIIPFTVSFIRYTVTTSNQISNKIKWFKKTIAGGEESNVINPRSYFRPNQFQDDTIDIPVSFDVNINSGLQIQVLASEVIVLALFIDAWTLQSLS
jgi:hypothetical protein